MSIKKKLSDNKKVLSTVFALAAVAIIFSFFPSCGQQTEVRSISTETHPTRDGHIKTVPSGTVSEDPEYIDDISFSIGLTEDGSPESVEVKLLYSSEGEGSEKEEVTLSGEFSETGSGMSANFSSESGQPINGSANCITPECTVINFLIQYRDGNGDLKTVTRQGARGNMTVEEPSAGDLESGTAAGDVVMGEYDSFPPASPSFLTYWQGYLEHLKSEGGQLITGDLPPGVITSRIEGNNDGTFIYIDHGAAKTAKVFARPINMRSTKDDITINGDPAAIEGKLINGERLINNPEACVEWGGEDFSEENRYASALLNAVLSFVGSTLRVSGPSIPAGQGACATLYLGEASKINGGKIESKKAHQNGLDVDISYITLHTTGENKAPFTEIDMGSTASVSILTKNTILWNLDALKGFYDTGMVSRFVTSPEIKAAFVKYARDNEDNKDYLTLYKDALEKIYPEEGFGNTHFKLEVGCAAREIRENQWCRDTNGRKLTWSVEWCSDKTCAASAPPGSEDSEATAETDEEACTNAKDFLITATSAAPGDSLENIIMNLNTCANRANRHCWTHTSANNIQDGIPSAGCSGIWNCVKDVDLDEKEICVDEPFDELEPETRVYIGISEKE